MITYTVGIDWDGDGTYTDESAYTKSMTIRRGREYGWDSGGRAPMRFGEVSIALNNHTRRFDPNYAGDLNGLLVPGKQARIQATENGLTSPVFQGWVLDIRPTGFRGWDAVIDCVDGFYWLNQQKCTTVSPQTNYPVISALYDLATMSNWPTISASVFPFTFPLTLSALGLEDNGDVIATWNSTMIEDKTILQAMEDIAAAFGGTLYVDATGNLRYKIRYTSAPATFVLTEANTIEAELRTPWSIIFNNVSVTPSSNSTAQISTNSTSITAYGTRNMAISGNDFIQGITHAANLSDHLILITPQKRFELFARTFGSAEFCFGRDLMDSMSFTGTYTGIDSVFFIGGIQHEIKPASNATTTLYLEESIYKYSDLQIFPFTFPLTLGLGW